MAVDYDPYSEEAMLEPQAVYARLRAEDPVHYLPEYDAWALAGFEDVWQAGSDSAAFSVLRGQTPNQVLLGEPAANLTFPELDPPEHRARRRVLAPRTPARPRRQMSRPCARWPARSSNPWWRKGSSTPSTRTRAR